MRRTLNPLEVLAEGVASDNALHLRCAFLPRHSHGDDENLGDGLYFARRAETELELLPRKESTQQGLDGNAVLHFPEMLGTALCEQTPDMFLNDDRVLSECKDTRKAESNG